MEVTQAGGGQVPATPATPEQPTQNTPTGQVPTPPPANGQVPDATTAGQQPQLTLEQALDALRKTRDENAAHRTRLKKLDDYEKAAAEAEKAKLSEVERAARERDEAKAQADAYKQRIAGYEVRLAAQKLGIIDPDLALLAIQSQLEYEDDGTPKNAEKLLTELVKAKPYLAGATQPGQPNQPNMRPPAQSGPAMNPARGQGQAAQSIPNRPLRGWDAVNWKP